VNLPSSVSFGDYRVKVVMSRTSDIELAASGAMGDSDTEAGVIRVRSDLHPGLQREVFVHEVLHHAWSLTGLPAVMAEQEEFVVRSLAPWLALALLPQDDA
jgi:hypothetical protein